MEKAPVPEAGIDEILPPGKTSGARDAASRGGDMDVKAETSRIIAYWMDEFIRIPGTQFRIGLDPIIAFVPFVGDFLASSAGVVVLLESARNGVSIPVLVRMSLNMLVNTFFDVFPVIGPFFSAWFKSNSRNLALLRQWQAGQQAAVRRSTWRMLAMVFLVLAFIIGLWLGMWLLIWAPLFKWLYNQL